MKLIVNKTCATITNPEYLTSGMVGKTIDIEYSSDFDGLLVTAVFTNGTETIDVINPGSRCVIPWEVLAKPNRKAKVGIYGYKMEDGEKVIAIPTVYACMGIVERGTDPNGDPSAEISPTIAEQLLGMIGDLDNLDTEAKNNLVAAINEAFNSGGGGGTNDHRQLTHRDAADSHPMSAVTGLVTALAAKGTYSKPSGGIPKTDLASGVQASLGKADTSVQPDDIPYVTPEQFGAVGDGVTDDTSAVQQAVNSGKTVFANGTYKITQTISVSNGLNLVGGTFAIESTDSSSMRGCFDVDAQDLNVSISGAKFTSTRDKTSFAPEGHARESGSKSSNVIAIMARGFDNLTIIDCVFENMEYDIKSMSPSTGVLCGNNLLLSGCKSNNASNAVFVMRTTNFVCDNCYFEPATLLGTGDHVFYIEKMVGSVEISNIRIEAQDDYIGYVFNFNDASNTQQAVSAKVDNCYVSAPRFISSFADNCTVNATTYISTYNGADNARGHIFSQAGHMSFVNCIIDCNGLEIGEYFRDCIFSGCDLHGRFQISSAVSPTNIQIFGSYLHCDNSSANSYIMYVERENAKVLINGCKLSTYGSSMMSLRKSTATLRVIGCDIGGNASRVFFNGSADTAYELIGNRITVPALYNPSYPNTNAIIQLNVFGAQTYLDADGVQSLVSGKQDAILDLATIRSGAALGATALQSVPNTYRTASAQDVIDSGKLSDAPSDGKQYARQNGAWSEVQSGGGGGAAIFEITVTEQSGSFTYSPTFAEIQAAITAGKVVVVNYNREQYQYYWHRTNLIYFERVFEDDGYIFRRGIYIDSNGTADVDTYQLNIPNEAYIVHIELFNGEYRFEQGGSWSNIIDALYISDKVVVAEVWNGDGDEEQYVYSFGGYGIAPEHGQDLVFSRAEGNKTSYLYVHGDNSISAEVVDLDDYALKSDLDDYVSFDDTEEAETLQIDNAVTSGSNNLITSGAVAAAGYLTLATLPRYNGEVE